MDSWEFGKMLRRWREGLPPDAVGVPAGRRRRAPGLRREELADLAGISLDYLTRLEQGRARSPSAQVVEALARALRLPDGDRELFFRLTGRTAPGPGIVPARVPASVQRLLDRLADTPVAVFDAALTLIVANPPYDALMGDTTAWRGPERNAVWRNLVGPRSRVVLTPEERADLEAAQVASMRLAAAAYPADRFLRRLVAELSANSPRFVELWAAGEPTFDQQASRRKTIHHSTVGPITLDCDTLVVAGDELRILVYTAEPHSDDAERLALAVVLGSQALTR